MTNFLILIRNVVLAAIFAILGLEFAPKTPEQAPEGQRDASVIRSVLP